MKLLRTVIHASTVLCSGVLLWSGCGEQPPAPAAKPAPPPQPVPPAKPALVSAEKNSFKEVTAHLDPGGSFYLYLGMEQWLAGLSGRVSEWRQFALAIPGLKSTDQANITKGFEVAARLIKNSGVEAVSGLGVSGIALEKGVYRSRAMLHHYRGQDAGYLWSAFGKSPHALDGLNLLPATTALAVFSDLDLPLLWSVLQQEFAQCGVPEVEAWVRAMPRQFEQTAGINWDQLLASLGGDYGFVVTLDEAKPIRIPLPTQQGLSIPEPGLMLVARVKNDLLFDQLDKLMQANQQLIRVDKDGLRMRTLPVPLPLPITLRPSWARHGDYFFFATSDALILEAVAVKSGQKPGLKSTDEFKQLARGIPEQGNNVTFLSQRFGRAFAEVQKQALAASMKSQGAETEWMQKLMGQGRMPFSYVVSANTDEGWLATGNGSQHPAKALLAPTVVPAVGLLSAIAIPNFVKARTTAQKNSCVANLKQIDGATQQWALENRKTKDSPVRPEDVVQYLRGGKLPKCPQGGTYTLTTVGGEPKCSVPGHKL